MAIFLAAGDLGMEGLVLLGLFALLVLGGSSVLLILILNWLAGKSGEWVNRREAAKKAREDLAD